MRATPSRGVVVHDVVPLRTRWGFAAGDTGNALAQITQNTWLLYFLVNIAGLSPVVAGTLFVVGRTVDAVADPIVGDLVDRHARTVPRLRWVRLANWPFGLSFALMWALPLLDGPAVLWTLVGLVLYGVLQTVVSMPLMSLTPIVAPTYDARTSLASWRVGSGILWSLVAVAGPPAIVLATTGEQELAASSPTGWLVMAVAYSAFMVVGYLIATRAIVEPPAPTGPPPPRLSRAVLGQVWRVRALRQVVLLHVVITIGVMISNATLPFFLESVIGMSTGEQSVSLLAFFVLAVVALPLWSAVARRWGKPVALALGCLEYAGALLVFAWLQPSADQVPLVALVVVLSGIGLSAVSVLPLAMLPDCAEHLEEATGTRREGLLYAVHGFATKTGGSIGVFAASIVASLTGYESGTSVQSEQTQLGLALVIGPLAASVFVAAAAMSRRAVVTRSAYDEVRIRVEAQRAAREREAPAAGAGERA